MGHISLNRIKVKRIIPGHLIAPRGSWFKGNREPVGTLGNKALCKDNPVRVGETGRRLAIAERDVKAVRKNFPGTEVPSQPPGTWPTLANRRR